MRTVHKFAVTNNKEFVLNLPKDAKVLSVAFQRGYLMMWVELDTSEQVMEQRIFRCYGTGVEMPKFDNLVFIQTVMSGDQNYVWHFYEKTPTIH